MPETHPQNAWSADRRLFFGLLAAILLAGLSVRLLDLGDPPFDFNPTRQFRAAGIARGLYYQWFDVGEDWQRETALALKGTYVELEPPLLEGLVALTYGLTGENLAVARVYSILFWTITGLATLLLAQALTDRDGGLVSLAYVFLLPFGIIASRSFQPEAWMVMWLMLTAYAAWRWVDSESWRWALAVGIFGGLAMLVKIFAALPLAGLMIALTLDSYGLRAVWRKRQVWAIAGLMLIPSLLYYLILHADYAGGYLGTWFVDLAYLLATPEFYIRWALWLDELVGLPWLGLGLAGMLLAKPRARWLLIGLWSGYVVYGLSVPHQTTTHDYYHLMLVPIIALSLAPLGALALGQLKAIPKVWQAAFVLAALGLLALPLWVTRSTLIANDYRDAPPYWEMVGEALPVNGRIIALTQGYGHPITYYGWRKVQLWPVSSELALSAARGEPEKEFAEFFASKTEGFDYFLVTTFNQLDQQPLLKDKLYADYPIYAEGDGYIIFDLRTDN
jgi:4-amino-4-deoxy-L-arabinose transferase-like glycosyltransferase